MSEVYWRTSPRTWTDGEYVRDYWLKTEISDRLRSLRQLNDYGVQLSVDEDQTIPTAETTAVSWDSAVWQVGNLWESGDEITIPVTGYWWIAMVCEWRTASGHSRGAGFYRGSKKVFRSSVPGNASQRRAFQKFRSLELLSAGDVIRFLVRQNAGGDLNIFPDIVGLSNVRGTVMLRGTV